MMNRSSFTFIATFVVVVLIVCLSSRTNAKGFECKKGKDSSFLDINEETITSFLQQSSLVEMGGANDAQFKTEFAPYKHKIKLPDGGVGWDRIELQQIDSKIRLKFKEKSDGLWALKFNVYNTKVSNKDASRLLTKMHNDMKTNSCKRRLSLKQTLDGLVTCGSDSLPCKLAERRK